MLSSKSYSDLNPMTEKSIIVIGDGIAGLAAGCYACMNQYKTTIFEAHDKPGGVCTAWRLGDYTFGGCIHWLLSSKPRGFHNNIWEELGALQNIKIVDHEQLIRVEDNNGRPLTRYTDINKSKSDIEVVDVATPITYQRYTNNWKGTPEG
jgi:phytoene dehydrogenase-like protein